jgi:hypothetical protein
VVWQRTVPQDVQGRVFAARAAIAMSIMPLASLAAGPLADRLFEPSMAEGGRWTGIFGSLVGTGRGRGMALILVACGAMIVFVAVTAFLSARLRKLDGLAAAASAAPEPSPLIS